MKHLGKFTLATVLAASVSLPALAQSGSAGGSAGASAGTSANTGIGANVGIGGVGANVGINSGTQAGVNGNTGGSGTANTTGSANINTNSNVGIDTTTPRSAIGTTTSRSSIGTTTSGAASANVGTNGSMNFDQYSTYLNRTATAGVYATNDIRTRFNALDTNNDNFISQTELNAGSRVGAGARTN